MKWLPDALRTHASLTPQSSQSSFDLKKEASPKPEPLSTHQQLRKSLRRLAFGAKKTTHIKPEKMKQQTINAVQMLAQISTHFLQKL
ncbi:unnamed protein product, partial [Mesorhabditis belari]|uniref:Uncharacterized protein n=1 Tax=Mesorhabditis belari TaxID=2138241 RepID=A0AAF3FQA5_9BILA